MASLVDDVPSIKEEGEQEQEDYYSGGEYESDEIYQDQEGFEYDDDNYNEGEEFDDDFDEGEEDDEGEEEDEEEEEEYEEEQEMKTDLQMKEILDNEQSDLEKLKPTNLQLSVIEFENPDKDYLREEVVQKIKELLDKSYQNQQENIKQEQFSNQFENQKETQKKQNLFETDNLKNAAYYLTGYINAVEKHPQIYSLRSGVFLKQKKYIEALNDMDMANQANPLNECSKSGKDHYIFTKALMRLSNDI
ncbi:hypothetical protein PPERSA_12123 [Pseudocohnilembus persalinus]|uniref:Uncharacterized protein n=1 Tax=Pseudocohnilembus persalinus TaxID=266149 RepID=A0A0V0QNS6_PSEPJ|nr:hypothetical protein PPERSA_12123 [Pseudocohnilembus persalinus]|eukprot:KRX03918.1 hypothetical protein PPERSA_12123 [Pseudocohnilembus persalinus]